MRWWWWGKSTFGSQRCDEIERRYPKKVQHKKGHKAAERLLNGVRDWTTAEGFGGGVTKKGRRHSLVFLSALVSSFVGVGVLSKSSNL